MYDFNKGVMPDELVKKWVDYLHGLYQFNMQMYNSLASMRDVWFTMVGSTLNSYANMLKDAQTHWLMLHNSLLKNDSNKIV